MKITQINISGAKGRATIFRGGKNIIITISHTGTLTNPWVVPASDADRGLLAIAQKLQALLDGHPGTVGDVGDYLFVLNTFVD